MRLGFYLTGLTIMLVSISAQRVSAAQIETLIMPGELVRSHADLESECSNCHKVFQKSQQTRLCLDCHEDVASDISGDLGFHGKSGEVNGAECAACHADHLGRDADIDQLDEETFDHDLSDFLLLGSHNDVECVDCHEPDQKYREAPGQCFGCHEEDDSHEGELGESCADCHNEKEWQDVEFDHSQTDFPLEGKHESVTCTDCHGDNVFDGTADDCFSCHEEDDSHDGRSGERCGDCHSPLGWDESSFDHERDTEFARDGAHADLTCDDCHSDEPFSDELDVGCFSCHEEDDNHETHFGDDCAACHTTEEWPAVAFDHDVDTDYVLRGAHDDIECEECHIEPIFDVALESGCNDCHADDDPHEGSQGTDCGSCHNETLWTEDVRFDHDLTGFPLLGNHIDKECDDCHESQVFEDAETDCVGCHSDDDPHEDRFTAACEGCHNPVDWEIWFFDHNTKTDFPLDGAHVTVACDDCHRQTLESMINLAVQCSECHRNNDVHDGEFGGDCGRCHSSQSFKDVESLR